MERVGSVSIMKVMDTYQPKPGMHERVHESMWTFNIGRTPCVNPGSKYTEDLLGCILIAIDNKEAKNLLPIPG